jgi:hypothetical protein
VLKIKIKDDGGPARKAVSALSAQRTCKSSSIDRAVSIVLWAISLQGLPKAGTCALTIEGFFASFIMIAASLAAKTISRGHLRVAFETQ